MTAQAAAKRLILIVDDDQLLAEFPVGKLTAHEFDGNPEFVTFGQKLFAAVELNLKIIVSHKRRETNFFEPDPFGRGFGDGFLFGQLILKLFVVNQFGHGWSRQRGNLDEIDLGRTTLGKCFFLSDDADLGAIFAQETNLRTLDLLIDAVKGRTH